MNDDPEQSRVRRFGANHLLDHLIITDGMRVDVETEEHGERAVDPRVGGSIRL